ncbi:MAG: hypothetical protein GYA23_07350 [Methanomicrobiales archaeon]|nr:hypothetical protein [Methanomicrobiales archaeon]
MDQFLEKYIERMRGQFRSFPTATAHEIASSFLAFKFGLYDKATSECSNAIALIPDSPQNAVLKKAMAILRASAEDRVNSVITNELPVTFSETDRVFLAISIPAERVEDPVSLEIDNALILIYVVALITSEEDEDALGEHWRLIIRLLNDYKKALELE